MLQNPFFFCSSDSNGAADQKYIVAYPVALFYLTFSMLTMF
jgi:hypothetical protein